MTSRAHPVSAWMRGAAARAPRSPSGRCPTTARRGAARGIVGDAHGQVDDAAGAGGQLADELVAVRAEVHQLDEVVDRPGHVLLLATTSGQVAAARPAGRGSRGERSRPMAMFSATVSDRDRRASWNERPSPSQARSSGPSAVTSSPSSGSRPLSGARKPEIRSNIVVLPAPLGPIRPEDLARCSSNDASSTAVMPPKRLVTPSPATSGVVGPRVATRRPARAPAPVAAVAPAADGRALEEHRPHDVVASRAARRWVRRSGPRPSP